MTWSYVISTEQPGLERVLTCLLTEVRGFIEQEENSVYCESSANHY